MPKSCAARQCCNRYSSRRKQLTFHRFPFSRPELLRQWVRNMGRGNFQPKQHTVLCSEHFRPECFSAFGNRKNLKHNAVPTEFAPQHGPQLAWESGGGQGGKAGSEDGQVPPCPEAAELPAPRRARPAQPSDHSYALLDAATLKQRLFRALRDNERLHRRLRAQRMLLWRLSRRLRGRRGAGEGPGLGRRQPVRPNKSVVPCSRLVPDPREVLPGRHGRQQPGFRKGLLGTVLGRPRGHAPQPPGTASLHGSHSRRRLASGDSAGLGFSVHKYHGSARAEEGRRGLAPLLRQAGGEAGVGRPQGLDSAPSPPLVPTCPTAGEPRPPLAPGPQEGGAREGPGAAGAACPSGMV